jgi:hypothetical protein
MGFYLPLNNGLPEIVEVVKMIHDILLSNESDEPNKLSISGRHEVDDQISLSNQSNIVDKSETLN